MLKDATCEVIEEKFRALPDEKRQKISPGYLNRCKREHAAALRVITRFHCSSSDVHWIPLAWFSYFPRPRILSNHHESSFSVSSC